MYNVFSRTHPQQPQRALVSATSSQQHAPRLQMSFHSQSSQRSSHPESSFSVSSNNDTAPQKEGWSVVNTDPLAPGRPPCQRSLHAAAVLRDSMFIFGGYDGQNRVNDFYQYHFPSASWKEIITLGAPLVGGVATAQQGHGGADTGGGANNHNNPAAGGNNNAAGVVGVGVHHRSFGATVTATGTPPTPRDRHAAVAHGSTFYIFGGFDGTSRVSDLYGFDVERLVWNEIRPRVMTTPTNNNVNEGNAGQAAGGAGRRPGFNNVDAGGGVGGNGNNNNNNAAGAWEPLRGGGDDDRAANAHQQQQAVVRQIHSPPSPRHSHAAVVYNDSMYVFGGYDGSYRSDFHEFDFIHLSWRPVFGSGRSPRARYRSTACVHGDTMILFGGHDGTRHLADVHTFDFESQVWSLLMTDGVPPLPRDSHVSVVYKDSMYIFGGSTGSAMNDLHELAFPPSSQEKFATDSSAAPDYATTAGSFGLREGENGEPALAKWRQIPPIAGGGIAVHRFCHVGAVHNGSLYVFGGYDGSSRLNDFVKYDLAIDDLFQTEIPPPTLLSDLRSILDDEGAMSLSDITLMVEGIPVRAHKLMLMRCPYFRAMLLGDMAESSQTIVNLEIVRHPIFMSVMEYLYTDDVSIPLDSAMELFVAADLFDIPRLQAMCERKLLESITIDNAATIFHAADVHSASSLRNKALGYVLAHFEAVSKTPAFEDMARCNVELVFEILKNR
jgi:N-acetylneuraminic acid mutarotase